MTTVLVVDDEPAIQRSLRISLQAEDYTVRIAGTGAAALAAVAAEAVDVVILDLGLPDLDGVEVVTALRRTSSVPVLVLSGRSHAESKVAALDAGADDYVTKPFDLAELTARLRAQLRRGPTGRPAPVRIGRHLVDVIDRRITTADGEPADVHLTPIEWQMLEVLVNHAGRLVSQRRLLTEVWGPAYRTETHYLRQYAKHLRRKLEEDPTRPRHLLTEPGLGYRLVL